MNSLFFVNPFFVGGVVLGSILLVGVSSLILSFTLIDIQEKYKASKIK